MCPTGRSVAARNAVARSAPSDDATTSSTWSTPAPCQVTLDLLDLVLFADVGLSLAVDGRGRHDAEEAVPQVRRDALRARARDTHRVEEQDGRVVLVSERLEAHCGPFCKLAVAYIIALGVNAGRIEPDRIERGAAGRSLPLGRRVVEPFQVVRKRLLKRYRWRKSGR